MGTAPAFASVTEAIEVARAALGYLAAADAAQLPAQTQAECLPGLEQTDAMRAPAASRAVPARAHPARTPARPGRRSSGPSSARPSTCCPAPAGWRASCAAGPGNPRGHLAPQNQARKTSQGEQLPPSATAVTANRGAGLPQAEQRTEGTGGLTAFFFGDPQRGGHV